MQEPRLERLERPILVVMVTASVVIALVGTVRWSMGLIDLWYVIPTWTIAAVGVWALFVERRMVVVVSAWAMFTAIISARFAPPGIAHQATLIGMLVFSLLIVAFIARRRMVAVVVVSAASFVAPLWWEGWKALAVAFSAAAATFVIAGLMAVIRTESIRITRDAQAMFANAPISMLEEDVSDVLDWIAQLKRSGVTDIDAYLRSHPDEVEAAIRKTRIVSFNQQAHAGYPTEHIEEDSGRLEAVDDVSFEEHVALLTDFFNGVYERTVTFPIHDSSGDLRWHQITSYPLPDGPDRQIVASVDITSVIESQEELERLVESKDRFVAAISHELRTPLAAVVGFSSELMNRPDQMTDDERSQALRLVHQEALEAANIIEDLLVAARADIGGVSATHDAIEVAVEIDRLLAMHPRPVEVSGVDELPAICADAVRIHQVLRNLLTNAARYGGPDHRIVCAVDGPVVSVEVRDNGTDLTQDEMDALFEPYARGRESVGITGSVGLGLTVARHLANVMGGSLTGFRDGSETVFRLELPVWGRCPVVAASKSHSTV